MNKTDVLRMVEEFIDANKVVPYCCEISPNQIRDFADSIRSATKEEDARICESHPAYGYSALPGELAEEIRASK